MFGTLLGPLPRPPLPETATPAELLAAVVRAQEAAGLEPITDAGFGVGEGRRARWRGHGSPDRSTGEAVLTGPYSAASGVPGAARAIRLQAPGAPPTARASCWPWPRPAAR